MQEAVTDKEIECSERNAYNNPAVSLSTADMTKYARQIWSSSAKYRNVATKMHRMVMRLNNIYSVGEYFFIDFSVENKTNIRFDIDEMRIKLSDKKQSKATNAQIVELTPSLVSVSYTHLDSGPVKTVAIFRQVGGSLRRGGWLLRDGGAGDAFVHQRLFQNLGADGSREAAA